MHPRWRFFRHDAGRTAGPPAAVYVLLFLACLAIGQWSSWRYGVVLIWPANGVLTAALLQLHRKAAVRVLAACFVINLIGNWLRAGYLDSEPAYMASINALLNLGEACLAAFIARRFCGAALDMRRPVRLARFALMAVVPAVLASAAIGSAVQAPSMAVFLTYLQGWVTMEVLGMLIVTPCLLLLARSHRFVDREAGARKREAVLLMSLLVVVAVAVFAQKAAPLPFLAMLPVLLIAFRLTPAWSALAVIVLAAIAAGFTYNGMGPFMLSTLGPRTWPQNPELLPIMRAAPVFNIYLAAILCVALPASTVLTERRLLEARLKVRTQAALSARRSAEQAALAKARFLSMMSHEMRTPLNGVSGFAELLAGQACLDAEAADQVEAIRRSSDRLLVLVEDILDFAHDEVEIVSAPFSMAATLREAMAGVRAEAAAKGLTLVGSGELDERRLYLGDARRIRQVLRHLLANAVKFTRVGTVEAALRLGDGGVEVRISDTGPGLAPNMLAQLFQPFSQADNSRSRPHEGAGIGLAVSRRLVAMMGGEIAGENLAGGGAAFTVSLPLQAAAAPRAEPDPTRPQTARVLVVDDHPTNREVARRLLEAVGCEVSIACDGMEAVAAAGLAPYDLILMDVRMPYMDGLEATRAIRAAPGPQSLTAIVAMTADAMPEDVARCLAAGMDAHLSKPISMAGLQGVLQRFLGQGGGTGPQAAVAAAS